MMKAVSLLKKFFLGAEVLEKIYSPVNGEILVVEDLFGRREMMIGRVAQSGGLAEKVWQEIFNLKFEIFNEKPNFQCLILGLGCGTLARILSEKHSQARITGVEIDPAVIELGKKYFSLGKIPNLEIIVGDAFKTIDDLRLTIHDSPARNPSPARNAVSTAGWQSDAGGRFDLIIVDLYLGQEFPKEAESEKFLRAVKRMTDKDGLIIFNRLNFNRKHQLAAAQFRQKLIRHFPHLKSRKIAYNLLIFASLEPKNKV